MSNKLAKTALAACGILLALGAVELGLRAAKILAIAKRGAYLPQYKTVPGAGHDLRENIPPFRFVYDLKEESVVWSNEMSCFDRPYKGEDYILLLGNSFTWGYNDFEKKFGTLLEQRTGVRVLKCGVQAYGTINELHKLRRVVAAAGKKPRGVIVLAYLPGDFIKNYLFPGPFEVVDSRLKLTTSLDVRTGETSYCGRGLAGCGFSGGDYVGKIFLLSGVKRWFYLRHGRLWRGLGFGGAVYDDAVFLDESKYPWVKRAWDTHLRAFSDLRGEVSGLGAGFLVALVPSSLQIYYSQPEPYELRIAAAEKKFSSFLASRDIDFLDITGPMRAEFLKERRVFHLRFDGHFNPAGDEFTAGLLEEKVRTKGWVK